MRPTCLPDYVQPVDNDLRKLFFLHLRLPSYLWHLLIPGKADGLLPELGDIFQSPRQSDLPHRQSTVSTEGMMSKVMYTPALSAYPLTTISPSQSEEYINDRYSPRSPVDETVAKIQNERRYRLLLTHDYHPSRKHAYLNVVLESFILTSFL